MSFATETMFNTRPHGWQAFELSVLRRLRFTSACFPYVGEPELAFALKTWGIAIAANDPLGWAATKATAYLANNRERLSANQIESLLEDAYVPGYELENPRLTEWFGETDAWWFDNLRRNIERLETPALRAIAYSVGFGVGDYVLAFDTATRRLRQPLTPTFRRLWQRMTVPLNNGQTNTATHGGARDFLARQQSELCYLQLPRLRSADHTAARLSAWREAWLQGGDETQAHSASNPPAADLLAVHGETKQQYLDSLEELLQVANHLPRWALMHVEDGYITSTEVVETVKSVRKVETIYTKDFTEFLGVRATIIAA